MLAAVALCGAALLLLVACWRHRAVLGLVCAALASALALSAPLGLISATSEALAGSLVASAIGTVLLMLGQAIERLLDTAPGSEGK